MISGTNGLLGAADGAFLLHLNRDKERAGTELWKAPPEPILKAVAALVTADRPTCAGTQPPNLSKLSNWI